METKLPYYMTYPLPTLFDDNRVERRDYEYVKSMYPEMAKKAIPYVEEEVERFEYEESMIYDEYPDKLQIRLMSRRIFEQMKKEMDEEMDDQHLRDLVELVLFQELLRRRNDRRRRQKRIIW